MKQDRTVIIGAGPFGLSAAAHLKAQGFSPLIFGKTMEFWRKMPPQMYLKSSWGAITISDPERQYTFDAYSKRHDIKQEGLVPLKLFLDYTQWFQEQAVPEVDETYVKMVTRTGSTFEVELEDGRSVEADRVIVATGLGPFAHTPEFTSSLSPSVAFHTQQLTDYSMFAGKNVAVIGSGQSAFESAGFLREVDATVEILARGPIHWINRRLYRYAGPARRLFYAPSDIGPAGVSWIVAFPMFYKLLPEKTRITLDARSVRPAVARWMRPIIEGHVTVTPNTSVVSAQQEGQHVCLQLSDGTTREVDYVVLATGYNSDIRTLKYLEPSLREQVKERDGYPFLNTWFESSVPHLYFTGCMSGYDFGPLCRHIIGSGASAVRIARHASRNV